MITTSNYKSSVQKIGVENLPSELQEAHNFLKATTSDFTNWKNTGDEFNQVKKLAFEKLQLFMEKNKGLNGKGDPLYIKQAKEDAIAYQWMETDKLKMIYRMELDAEIEGDATPEESQIRKTALEKELRKRDKTWLKTFKPMNGLPDATKEIRYIEWFLSFHNKRVKRSEFVELLHELQTDITEKEIRKTSPLAKQILKIQATVVELLEQNNNAYNITVSDSLKSEFSKALKEYRTAKKKSKDADKPKSIDLSGVPEKTTGEIMSSVEFAKKEFSCLGFTDKWLNFIGDPSPGFTAMVFGKPKMGKSYLCVDFAGYLARHFGKVLYVAKEERLDATLQKKLKDKDVAHENLFVTDSLPADLSAYNFIILDSVNLLGLSPEDLRKLKSNNPGKGFIYVFQTTKTGNFRGANSFQHDVDIVIEVPEKGNAIQFGRFNQGGEMTIFEDAIPQASEELSGTSSKKYPTWTTPKHLDKRDHAALKDIYDLYKKGELKEAFNYAHEVDTIVREEIPGDIWKKMGGQLTKTGEEKLKAKKGKVHVIGKTATGKNVYSDPMHPKHNNLKVDEILQAEDIHASFNKDPLKHVAQHGTKEHLYELTNETHGTKFKSGDIDEFENDSKRKQLNSKDIKAIVSKGGKVRSHSIVFNNGVRVLKGIIERQWELELADGEYIEILDIAEKSSDGFAQEINDLHTHLNSILETMWKAMKEWDQEKGQLEERNKDKFNPALFANRKDDENPAFLFNLTSTKVLVDALDGGFDIIYLVHRELANRGLDWKGKWVGFDEAKKIHRVE